MNKKAINRDMAFAYEALKTVGIVENNAIQSTYRGQISTFGSAIISGSLLPAIAFFSDNRKSSVERKKLMDAILLVLKADGKVPLHYETLFMYAKNEKANGREYSCEEDIINAAIALKLAMNLYELK